MILLAATAFADEPQRSVITTTTRFNRATMALGGLDYAPGGGTTYQLGVLSAFEHSSFWDPGLGAAMWAGFGPRVSITTGDHRSVTGIGADLVGRSSFLGCSGGGLELSLGAATVGFAAGEPLRSVGVFGGGFYISVYYFDVGYAARVPFGGERPDWMGAHNLSFRFAAPARRWGHREWTETRPGY